VEIVDLESNLVPFCWEWNPRTTRIFCLRGDDDDDEHYKRWRTHLIVGFIKDLMGQEFQWATVNSGLRRKETLDGLVCFAAVGRAGVEDHLSLYSPSLWVPGVHTHTHTHT